MTKRVPDTRRDRRTANSRGSRVRRADGVPARHPQRPRRDSRRDAIKARLRLNAKQLRKNARQAASAARVLGMSTTRRAAVLAIVICALAFTLAVPLRTYLSQRAEIRVQEQRQAELRAEVEQLEARKAALSDPAEVQAEARRRLRYVMPGETPYLVQLPEDTPQGREEIAQRNPGQEDSAWYQQLWKSLGG